MYIINGILTESDAERLSDEQWELLANCSSDSIVQNAFDYCNNSDNSGLVKKVKRFFSFEFGIRSLGVDEELKSKILYSTNLTYQDIMAEVPLETLCRMRDSIIEINGTENTAPYISPIENDNYFNLMGSIKEDGDKRTMMLQMSKFAHMFKSKKYEHARGTLFKSVYACRSKFDLILEGLDFLITAKEQGIEAIRWRHL